MSASPSFLQRYKWPTIILMILLGVFLLMLFAPRFFGDMFQLDPKESRYLAANAGNQDYIYECGACHIAYPAQVLPKRSWHKLTNNLYDHFGEDATTDKIPVEQIQAYLNANASDSENAGKFRDFMKQIQSPAPVRVTELRFWRLKHDRIIQKEDKMVLNNPDVESFSRCNACHEKAEQGEFDKQTVDIPNINREEYAR